MVGHVITPGKIGWQLANRFAVNEGQQWESAADNA